MMTINNHMSRIDFMEYVDADSDDIAMEWLTLGMHLQQCKQRLRSRGMASDEADRVLHKRVWDYRYCWGPERTCEAGHHREERFKPGGDLFVGPVIPLLF